MATFKIKFILLFLLYASLIMWASGEDVRILPLTGGIGTAKIIPGDGTSTAYRMDFLGQKAICFQSASTTIVYVSSASSIGSDGWGFYNKGENVCVDLASGTTIYFYGTSSGGDIRAFIAK